MTDKAIAELSTALCAYILQIKRAPTENEITKFVKEFLRARSKGRLMV